MTKDRLTPNSERSGTTSPLRRPARQRWDEHSKGQSKGAKRRVNRKRQAELASRKKEEADKIGAVPATETFTTGQANRLAFAGAVQPVSELPTIPKLPPAGHSASKKKSFDEITRSTLAALEDAGRQLVVATPAKILERYTSVLNDPILQLLAARNVPRDLWPKAMGEIERLIAKLVTPAPHDRPLWDDRAKYPELATLSAPEFLKRVWADQIAPDGSIEKAVVREKDRSLMAKVDNYVSTRQRRQQDDGDARGLHLIAQRTRPRPTNPR